LRGEVTHTSAEAPMSVLNRSTELALNWRKT
jgi:hypothetical protein